jgi:hypothetical protein
LKDATANRRAAARHRSIGSLVNHQPEKVHSTYLFPAIVLLLVAQPILASFSPGTTEILVIPLAATLVLGIWSLDRGGRWFRSALGLGAVVLGLAALDAKHPNPAYTLAGTVCVAALSSVCVILGARWLFRAPRITAHGLLFALSEYLLIGLTFGLAHVALYLREPTWYQGVNAVGHAAKVAELAYFSLGPLTTTAYGDILPTQPLSRLLCNVEAVVGQMYVAVLIGMVVSGYASGRIGPSTGGGN